MLVSTAKRQATGLKQILRVLVLFFVGTMFLSLTGCDYFNSSNSNGTEGEAIWSEDFENYAAGEFPTAWTPSGNADAEGNRVVASHSRSQSQAFRLKGQPGGCWAAIAYHPLQISTSEDFEISFAVRPTTEGSEGCHGHRARVHLKTKPEWNANGQGLLGFDTNGRLSWGNGKYDPGEWTEARVRYQRNGDQVQLTYWLDGTRQGSRIIEEKDYESELAYVGLSSGDFTSYFDQVSVRRIE